MTIGNEKQITRRTFLKTTSKVVGSLVFSSGSLCAIAGENKSQQEIDDLELYDFVMPRVKFTPYKRQGQQRLSDDTWNNRPGGDANLLTRLSTVIRCRTKPITGANNWQPQWAREGQLNAVVTFDSLDQIKKYPFLFMTGENYFRFNDDQKYNLKEYITRGGFLLMDDCVVGDGGDFFIKVHLKCWKKHSAREPSNVFPTNMKFSITSMTSVKPVYPLLIIYTASAPADYPICTARTTELAAFLLERGLRFFSARPIYIAAGVTAWE